ncbi:type II secretion system protein GspM [Kangiella sp. TOML190]|uniref:type II secretion system protein GspM n=1 Tax=Kangiella sp. TOML190 TaxID=2931351 RepID=UPI002040C605|nr:type II secretion system protein M [Kangiella sp. TOML190]
MSGLKTWYVGLNQRERIMVNLLATSFAILLLTLLVIMPLKKYKAGLEADRNALAAQVVNLKQQVAAIKGGSNIKPSQKALNQLVTQTAQNYNISFSSIQERKRDKEIQLRMDEVEFDNFIRWITLLEQKNGLIIDNLRVSDTDEVGKVDVSLKVLKAG